MGLPIIPTSQSQPIVGLQGKIGDGYPAPIALSGSGAIVSQPYGKFYDAAKRQRVFMASNTGAQAVSVALATTYTGLCLSNEPNSQYDLVLLRVGLALTVAPAAIASLHLIGNVSTTTPVVTHTTPVTPVNTYLGSGITGVGKVDSAATIPTPLYLQSLSAGFTAAALPGGPGWFADIDGAVVLKPGSFVAIGALTAVTGIWSMLWAEVLA